MIVFTTNCKKCGRTMTTEPHKHPVQIKDEYFCESCKSASPQCEWDIKENPQTANIKATIKVHTHRTVYWHLLYLCLYVGYYDPIMWIRNKTAIWIYSENWARQIKVCELI